MMERLRVVAGTHTFVIFNLVFVLVTRFLGVFLSGAVVVLGGSLVLR